jgi:hypothetical protein
MRAIKRQPILRWSPNIERSCLKSESRFREGTYVEVRLEQQRPIHLQVINNIVCRLSRMDAKRDGEFKLRLYSIVSGLYIADVLLDYFTFSSIAIPAS